MHFDTKKVHTDLHATLSNALDVSGDTPQISAGRLQSIKRSKYFMSNLK